MDPMSQWKKVILGNIVPVGHNYWNKEMRQPLSSLLLPLDRGPFCIEGGEDVHR